MSPMSVYDFRLLLLFISFTLYFLFFSPFNVCLPLNFPPLWLLSLSHLFHFYSHFVFVTLPCDSPVVGLSLSSHTWWSHLVSSGRVPGRVSGCVLLIPWSFLNIPVIVSTGTIVIVGGSVSDTPDSESPHVINPPDLLPTAPVTSPEPPQQETEESQRDDEDEEEKEEEEEMEEEEEEEKETILSVTRREGHDCDHAENRPPIHIPQSSTAPPQTDTRTQHLNQTAAPDLRFSHSASVSDDPESVSMIDVRCDDDVFLNPHSQVRHELMHNQYNQLKEEEDHWQDDLARWKSRRRSVSQDLIKKEEERKMMERLLSGGEGPSQRRKSIKTYKEIVQDKERRERELHDAYRRARTPEEAHTVLQRYAQRFSISESVLERLKLPKLLERSISADPSAPFAAHLPSLADFCDLFEPSDQDDGDGSVGVGGGSGGGSGGGAGGGGGGSNPMQYLRQQSLPAPKFTSTVEAMVTSFTPAAPERPLKAVPLLAPKPYAPQRRTGDPAGDKPVKVDRMLRLNGETEDKMEQKEEARREDSPSPLQFLPCPVSDDAETQEFRVTASSTSPSSSPTHAPKQASPPHASPPHAPKQASPPHTPDTAPPSDSHTRGSPVKSAEEERTSEETLLAEDTPPVTTSQDQAPESQEVDERGPPESQDALEQPESLEQTAPSRPSSLPTELLSEPVAIPLDEDERLPLTETEQSQATGETTCTTAPSLHTTAPTPVPTDPGSEDGHQSTTQISDPVDQLESSHLLAPLSRPPGVLPSAELYNTARAPLASPNPKLRWEFFAPQESPTKELSDVSVPPTVLSMVKRADQWSWDPDEERRRQERWQREQERMLQEKYRREQEKLKQEWERAQREVEEEERKYHEEEQKILEETVAPLTPHSPALPPSPSPLRGDTPPVTSTPQDTVVRSLADWERKQEILERQTRGSTEDWSQRESEPMDRSTEEKSSSHLQKAESADLLTLSGVSEASSRSQQNGQRAVRDQGQPRSPHAPPAQGEQPTLGL
ncbi:LIM and calponin homology domains-containing protein 1 isoform X10 [Clupea harengus]|uniref:LIM and calponin homology domains-containing protein 1 isoform X10 n=1 Tax=Clupea harengus TaxID=7950 RepID=A0A8M1K4M8_CLUHA|nr:LIM and calponin homology domains-containing protein 1 isoform X10 [Clupea harengus]